MNKSGSSDKEGTSAHLAVPANAEPTIFVDLDGTLIWTWTPLITSVFMSVAVGLPISVPPTKRDGYLKLTKVPFENSKFSLTCRRPKVRQFLRSLRALGEVCLITHAPRDYAVRMNRSFSFGFTDDQIFTIPADHQKLCECFCSPQKLTVLIDDEGPGWNRRWKGRTNHKSYDHRADARHRTKCHYIGVSPNSRRDIAYPEFSGRKDDLFLNANLRRSIVCRVAAALRVSQAKRIS